MVIGNYNDKMDKWQNSFAIASPNKFHNVNSTIPQFHSIQSIGSMPWDAR